MLELNAMKHGNPADRSFRATRAPFRGAARSAARGFTLTELLLTLLVLIIVLSLGIPAFTETVRQNRITAQANDLHALLLLARVEAIKRGEPVEVALSRFPASDSWSAEVVDPADPGAALRRTENAATPVSLGASWPAVDNTWSLAFTALGQPVLPSGASEIRLGLQHHGCTRNQRREVTVERSGQISIDPAPASRVCQTGDGDV